MEPTKGKKIAVGLFIIAGFVLFTVAIFVIGGKDNLFTPTFQIRSEFVSVAGLKSGSSVRLNGIVVGKVESVVIQASNRVLVIMTIESGVREFIKNDSRVTIGSDGLVGNKVVEIIPGTSGTPGVEDNAMLASDKPIEVQDIMVGLKESSDNASDITKDLSDITSKVNEGQGTLGQLVNNDGLYTSIDSTFRSFAGYSTQMNVLFGKINSTIDVVTVDVEQLTKQINLITTDFAEITRKMNSSESVIGTLLTDTVFANNIKAMMQNANATTKNLENGSFSFAQNMEALKHNFLFKGYFEDIGYWDQEDWEKNMDKKALELRIKEQELLKKEKELKDLENRLRLEQKLENGK